MADEFGLLLEAVVHEALAGHQSVAIAAEGMPHQREVERAVLLCLPDVGQLVDEEALPAQRLARKVVRPAAFAGMKPDRAHWGHCRAPRVEPPPFALDQAYF